jgi:hypothetical protein
MFRGLYKLPPLTAAWFALLCVMLLALRSLADYSLSQPHQWFDFGRWRWLHWPDYFALAGSFVSDDWRFRLLTWGVWPGYLLLQGLVVVMRLQTLRLPKRWVLFLLVPAVNLVFLLVLVLVPIFLEKRLLSARHRPSAWQSPETSGEVVPMASPGESPPAATQTGTETPTDELTALAAASSTDRWQAWHKESARHNLVNALILTLLLLVPLGWLLVYVAADLSQQYGITLFVLGPFVAGWLTASILHRAAGASLGDCLLGFLMVMILGGAVLLAVGMEGLVCLLMASPLVITVGMAGCAIGYLFARSTWLANFRTWSAGLLVMVWPIGLATEIISSPRPTLHAVRTEIIVQAPVEVVWKATVSFEELPEPREEMFRLGVAYPIAAKIAGQGVGAVRHCIFNTGTFVEPIQVWQPPFLLRFAVTDQPPPMQELSPWPIDPPHLHGCLVCRQGEFRLEPLGPHQTRLIGTTWYELHMWPEWYWHLWSDYCIHQIHARVLRHIANLAETHAAEDAANPRP